ncbi:MAG TPA: hypothetical protein VEO74_09895 [Thermoanaerobaculia bacterium]|nr:hypothetical protein [Thermoanaerobaculia bacterium]
MEWATVVTSAIVAAFTAFVTAAFESRRKIDNAVRDKRIETYPRLWEETSLAPRWPEADVTYSQLRPASERLRDWYYFHGGMYLSSQARVAYGRLQRRLGELSSKSDRALDAFDYRKVRNACSALRSELTTDLLSRTRGLVFRAAHKA